MSMFMSIPWLQAKETLKQWEIVLQHGSWWVRWRGLMSCEISGSHIELFLSSLLTRIRCVSTVGCHAKSREQKMQGKEEGKGKGKMSIVEKEVERGLWWRMLELRGHLKRYFLLLLAGTDKNCEKHKILCPFTEFTAFPFLFLSFFFRFS